MKLEHKRRLIRPTLFFISMVICLALASAQSAFAQSAGSGTLRGTVKDPQGAVVAGASVVLTSERSPMKKEGTSSPH